MLTVSWFPWPQPDFGKHKQDLHASRIPQTVPHQGKGGLQLGWGSGSAPAPGGLGQAF